MGGSGPSAPLPVPSAPPARWTQGAASWRAEAEALLYLEARLMDERRFEEWLDLFTPDARYVLPGGEDGDGLALVDDDRATMEDRVARLRSPGAHAQSPPSRTLHVVANVEVEPASTPGSGAAPAPGLQGPDAVRAHSTCVVYEARLGQVRSFAGRCLHVLRADAAAPEAGGARAAGRWRIAAKTVWLVDRDQALYNLTFLI